MAIHVSYDLCIRDIPRECIEDCSQPGPADAAVAHWREALQFSVDRNAAITFLEGYGAWERDELEADGDETLADRILWLACGNFSEYITEAERAGFNPFEDDRPEDFDPSCGSDIFVLE